MYGDILLRSYIQEEDWCSPSSYAFVDRQVLVVREKMLSLHVSESVGEFSFREVSPTNPVNLVVNCACVETFSSLLDELDL